MRTIAAFGHQICRVSLISATGISKQTFSLKHSEHLSMVQRVTRSLAINNSNRERDIAIMNLLTDVGKFTVTKSRRGLDTISVEIVAD